MQGLGDDVIHIYFVHGSSLCVIMPWEVWGDENCWVENSADVSEDGHWKVKVLSHCHHLWFTGSKESHPKRLFTVQETFPWIMNHEQ